ncbi:MAG: TIGR03960 family B12-binding radical SAM protein [Acidobacteria bacterium]|nr:MAG: TIGR03960 family B12-binding radical SAM protein [Acidobacteriota bacterium]
MDALDRILPKVEKPSRYLGGETNSIVKDHAQMRATVAFGFPDVYEIGMSHLGLRILYSLLNEREDVACERVFAPWPDMERELRQAGLPLQSLETRTPMGEFDIVGFSLQYEMTYSNILTMLDLADIPFRTEHRSFASPLVVGGGPVAFAPEPIADFFDCFVIGDAEEAFPRLIDLYVELRDEYAKRPQGRRALLRRLADIPGVYVPSLYRTEIDPEQGYLIVTGPVEPLPGEEPAPFPIKRAVVEDLADYPFPSKILVPHSEIVHDRVSMEIARGCTEGCRFCQAGIIYRPVRERSPREIIETTLKSLDETGYNEVTLSALSVADYSCFPDLLEKVAESLETRKASVSLGSLRVYGITDKTTRDTGRVRKGGFTIAPEAGTQRMRDVINKGITQEDLEKATTAAFSAGWERIKLYFMCGLPTETQEDLDGILDRCKDVLRLARQARSRNGGEKGKRRPVQVGLSVSSFIPKPFSAFQWWGMDSEALLEEKQRYVRTRLPRGVKLSRHHVPTSVIEGVLARGDRRLGKVIEWAWHHGARFDGWTECFRRDVWDQAFAAEGLDPDLFIKGLPVEAKLPWDHIDTLVTKEFLVKDYLKAFKNKFAPACEKPYKGFQFPEDKDEKLVCYSCGLECDLKHIYSERKRERQLLMLSPSAPQAEPEVEEPVSVDKAHRYLCRFTKLGRPRFLSHLDVMRTLQRALRRAKVPMLMSQGFSPKPVMAFGPALALGIESAEEWVEFHSLEPLDTEQVLPEVNRDLPEGIRFLSMEPFEHAAASLTVLFDRALYSATLPESEGTDLQQHRRQVAAFNERTSVLVEKIVKGKTRVRDLKHFVGQVEVQLKQDALYLTIPVRVGSGGSARPEDVLQAIYGHAVAGVSIRRERLLQTGEPGPQTPTADSINTDMKEPVESRNEGARI